MNAQKSRQTQTYNNVMELMVAEEVDSQMAELPSDLARYIKPLEVATYALNKLPPLYASSEEGWQRQQQRAQQQWSSQITVAVRRAIAAVQRDPLRKSTPLHPDKALEPQIILSWIEEYQCYA